MKRCPECNRIEPDDALVFCRSDGTALISDSGSFSGDAGTAKFASGAVSSEIETSILPHTTDSMMNRSTAPTTVLPAQAPATTGALAKPKRRKAAIVVTLLITAVVAVAIVAGGYFYYSRKSNTAIESIAVLPFENRSGSSDTDYLSDGLTDSLIYRLSQLPNLKVSPTSSVMRYKGKETDVAQIAKELEVDAVMSGRLVQRGDDLSISVQLIDSRTRKLIWAEQYDRKMADLLTTQREIATTITQKLQLNLAGAETKGITKKYTNSNEAYQLYLKGRYYLNKRTGESISRAITQFQQAADTDPNYALAYVGLADSYLLLEDYTGAPANETCPKAKSFAERALQIDSDLAEAHTSLAYVFSQTWLWSEADAEFKRSNDLNPNYAPGHQWYSVHLRHIGRFADALKEAQKAMDLDPLTPINGVSMAQSYMGLGDFDAGMEQAKKIIELDPAFPKGHEELGSAYIAKKLYPEAVAEMQKAVELSGRGRRSLGFLGYALALSGKRDDAMVILKELTGKYEKHEALGQDVAAVYVGLGNTEQAFSWLEKGFQDHSGQLPRIRWEAPFASLRGDPRYADLLKRMGQ
jgi:TolB-like protein/Flp pilus assembly protein TadD